MKKKHHLDYPYLSLPDIEDTKEIKATIETSINGYVEAPAKEEQEISFEKSNKEIWYFT